MDVGPEGAQPAGLAASAAHPASALAAVSQDMAAYYRRRAAEYERVYRKPERQADLRAMEAWVRRPFAGRRVLEIACGTGWWTPHAAADCASWLATYQSRTLDDGSVHEVLKNFPGAHEVRALLGDRAAAFEGTAWTHYWAAAWTVRS